MVRSDYLGGRPWRIPQRSARVGSGSGLRLGLRFHFRGLRLGPGRRRRAQVLVLRPAELAVAILVGFVEAVHQLLVAGGLGLRDRAVAVQIELLECKLLLAVLRRRAGPGARARLVGFLRGLRLVGRLVVRFVVRHAAQGRAADGVGLALRRFGSLFVQLRARSVVFLLHGRFV